MRILESISAGQAFAISLLTGGPSVAYAAIQDDFTPVATGAAVGFLAFLVTVWRSSNDSRFEAILKRLDRAEKEADDYRNESTAAKEEAAKLSVDLAFANAKLEKTDHA